MNQTEPDRDPAPGRHPGAWGVSISRSGVPEENLTKAQKIAPHTEVSTKEGEGV
jgi:hypothetical protein